MLSAKCAVTVPVYDALPTTASMFPGVLATAAKSGETRSPAGLVGPVFANDVTMSLSVILARKCVPNMAAPAREIPFTL